MSHRCFNVQKYFSLKAAFWYGVYFVLVALTAEAVQSQGNKPKTTFDSRLRQWISITSLSERSGLREVCGRLSKSHHVAINVDRKLDPHRPVTLPPPVAGSIIEVLNRIAVDQNAELRQIGDALLILSRNSAEKLRTLVALRTAELRTKKDADGKPIRYSARTIQRIMNRHSWQWDDLSRPRDLIIKATEKSRLKIENPEIIPHDLWYRGELPHAHLIEFLSFVLVQYDLTFSWKDETSIVILKAPSRVVIEQTHRVTENKLREYRDKLTKEFPQSEWKPQRSRVVVTGPIELHEQLNILLSKKSTVKTSNRVPWKKRRYTMRVVHKPLGEVLKFLDAAGLPIQFNKQQIESLGIALDQLISFETEQADAKQLMEALCNPIKLPFSIGDDEIRIGKSNK